MGSETDEKSSIEKHWWEKRWWDKVIVPIVIPLIIGGVASCWGYFIGSALKDKELKVKYVEIALGILREDPAKDCNGGLRRWAVDIIDKCAVVELNEDARKCLKAKRLSMTGGAVIGGEAGVGFHPAEEGAPAK
jgi:hypothetical protein